MTLVGDNLTAPGPRLTKPAYGSPKLAAFHSRLYEAAANVHVLVVGDSTGALPTRWPRLLADSFAAAFPAWTVVYKFFDSTNLNWTGVNAQTVTVQTGTNGRTLTLWNASVSGQVIGFAQNNSVSIVNGYTPDMVLWNYGHNSPQLTDDYRAVHVPAMLQYIDAYPNACQVSMTQNPRDPVLWAAPASPTYSEDQGRQRAIADLSTALGVTFIDVNQEFLRTPNYSVQLLNPDGLHPNDANGSPLWRDLIWAAIKPGGQVISHAPAPVTTQVWVPASEMYAVDGTPTLGVTGGLRGWSLPHGSLNTVAAEVHIPSAWKRTNISLLWMPATGAAGNIRLTTAHQYMGQSVVAGTWAADSSQTVPAPVVVSKEIDTSLYARTALSTTPLALRIGRDGTDAADTYADAAIFLGLRIQRAY